MTRKHAKRFNRKPVEFASDMQSTSGLNHYNSVAKNYAQLRANGWSAKQAFLIAKSHKATRDLERSFSDDCPLDDTPDSAYGAFDTQWREESDGLIVRVEFCSDDIPRNDSDCWGEMTTRDESAGWQHETTPGEAGEEVYAWHWNYKDAIAHYRRTMSRHAAHLMVLGQMRREYDSFQEHQERQTFGVIVTVFDEYGDELASESIWGFDHDSPFAAFADYDMIGDALDSARIVHAAPDVAAALVDMRGV